MSPERGRSRSKSGQNRRKVTDHRQHRPGWSDFVTAELRSSPLKMWVSTAAVMGETFKSRHPERRSKSKSMGNLAAASAKNLGPFATLPWTNLAKGRLSYSVQCCVCVVRSLLRSESDARGGRRSRRRTTQTRPLRRAGLQSDAREDSNITRKSPKDHFVSSVSAPAIDVD